MSLDKQHARLTSEVNLRKQQLKGAQKRLAEVNAAIFLRDHDWRLGEVVVDPKGRRYVLRKVEWAGGFAVLTVCLIRKDGTAGQPVQRNHYYREWTGTGTMWAEEGA